MSNYNINRKCRSNYINSKVSQNDDNDNFRQIYNYNTGSYINKKNKSLFKV